MLLMDEGPKDAVVKGQEETGRSSLNTAQRPRERKRGVL